MPKPKAEPAPRTASISYYGEQIGQPQATIDVASVTARINEIGVFGWQLICFTPSNVAWFMQQGTGVPPPPGPTQKEANARSD